MQQQGQNRIAFPRPALILLFKIILLGARLAEHHRIDDLKMRRVGRQRQVNLVFIEFAVRRSTEVVFHIA